MCVSVWGATCKIVLRGAMCKIMSIHVQPSTMLLLRRRLAESQLKEVEKNIPEPLPECNSTRLSQIVFVETKTYCAQMASTFHSVYIFDFFPTWVCQAFGLGNDTMETLPMDLEQAEQVVEAIRKSDDIKDIQDTEMVMDGEKKGGKDKNYYDPEKYQYPDNQLGLTPSPSPKKGVAETESEDSITTTEPETTPKPHLEVSPEPSAPGSAESVDKEKEEDGKEKDLPMVTREAQQAFKEMGSRVSKSDTAAAAAPAKTKGKAAMKRPAAAKKGPEKPKSKQPKKNHGRACGRWSKRSLTMSKEIWRRILGMWPVTKLTRDRLGLREGPGSRPHQGLPSPRPVQQQNPKQQQRMPRSRMKADVHRPRMSLLKNAPTR